MNNKENQPLNQNRMEKEFVPYELSLRLKQLGFDEPCFGYYDMGQKFNFPGSTMNNRNFINLKTTMAPLFQQAFRWFREKYQLVVDWNHSNHDNFGSYIGVCIKNIHFEETIVGVYKSYEEAELACLEKLIKIVEENELNKQSN